MAANLTPQYRKAEDAYRQATSLDEELRCLQDMLRELPKHKGTDRLHAELKQKISRAKKEVNAARASGKRSASIRIPRRSGSCRLDRRTECGQESTACEVNASDARNRRISLHDARPAPGMMEWQGFSVQIIDTPPIAHAALDSSLQGIIRGADLVLFVVGLGDDDAVEYAAEALARLHATKTRLARDSSLDSEDLGRSYTQTIMVYNQVDADGSDLRLEILKSTWQDAMKLQLPHLKISALRGDGLDALKDEIVRALKLIHVYTKHPHEKEPDMTSPYAVRQGATLLDVAALIHHDLASRLKGGRVWNNSRPHPIQVTVEYEVQNDDIVELNVR